MNIDKIKESSNLKILINIAFSAVLIFIGLILFSSFNFNIPLQLNDVIGTSIGIIIALIFLFYKYPIEIIHNKVSYNDKLYTFLEYSGFKKESLTIILSWGIPAGLIISAFNFPYSYLKNEFLIPQQYFFNPSEGYIYLFFYLIFMVLVIPLIEEFYFRGLIYKIFKSKINVEWGIILSSIFFMVMHSLSIRSFINALIMCYAYHKSKLLGSSIIAHCLSNLIWFTAVYLGT